MEKKEYIMPTVRVKAVKLLLMAGSLNNEEGDGNDLAKDIYLPEDNGNDGIEPHDVWED